MAGKGRVYDSKENGGLRQDDGYLCWPPRWLALRDDLGGGTQQRAPNVRRSDRRPANSPTTLRTCVQLLRLAALANRLVYFRLCLNVRYPRHQIGAAHRIAPQIKGRISECLPYREHYLWEHRCMHYSKSMAHENIEKQPALPCFCE